jgi:hypothetical protein
MYSTTHVQTAGQGKLNLGRQFGFNKMVEDLIHNRLNNTRGVSSRSMAVNPTLSMHTVGNTGTGTTNRELVATAGKVVQQRLYFILGVNHELYVVTGGETEETVAMGISDVTELTNLLNRDQASRTYTYGVALSASLRNMYQYTRLNHFMVKPLALVIFDNLGVKLFKMWGTDICDSVRHGICWIVTHNKPPSNLYIE